MKTVNETYGKLKGEDNVKKTLTGKGAFSAANFGDLVGALANDVTFKIPTYDKDGKKAGEVCVSDMIRADIKATIEKAHCPQKSELGVIDTADIVTKNTAQAIPYIVMEQLKTGRKFDLPRGKNVEGSIYLADVPKSSKTVAIRDPKTQENLGTVVIETDDYVQVRSRSKAPAHLQKKTRK